MAFVTITIRCGCDVSIPGELTVGELSEYLTDNELITVRHEGPQEIATCTNCRKEWTL